MTIGERDMAFFTAKNLRHGRSPGSATFNVSPPRPGKYFTKIQCFCFTQQTLKPGEEARMPVIFYVDPKFLKDPDTARHQRDHVELHLLPGGPGRDGRLEAGRRRASSTIRAVAGSEDTP